MHIGLIIYGTLEIQSGGYLYDRILMNYLREQGHQIEIVALEPRNYWAHWGDNLAADLRQHLLTADFDVLLQDELNHPSLFWLNQQIRSWVRYPIVTIVHLLRCTEKRAVWKNRFYRLIERSYLRSVDGYILNSQTTLRDVQAIIGRAEPHVIAYPAADRFAEAQAQLPDLAHKIQRNAPLRLLYVGNIIPRKGLHTLLRALDHVPAQRWKLDIVGDMEADLYYSLAMQRYVAQSPWKKQVRYWGPLDHDELADRYNDAHLLIMPSEYESFGIVYLEALSFGVPAVGSTAGAASEIITPGHNGFLIDPGDDQALAQIINDLHQNRPLLLELSQNARQRYEQHPTWSASCEQIHQFLLHLTTSQNNE